MRGMNFKVHPSLDYEVFEDYSLCKKGGIDKYTYTTFIIIYFGKAIMTKIFIPQIIIDVLNKCITKSNTFNGKMFKKLYTEEIANFLEKYNIEPKTLYHIWRDNLNYIPSCPICGNPLITYYKGQEYCSMKCVLSSEKVKEKKRQTSLERYGVENPSQSKEIQTKVKQTSLEKFGTTHYSKTKEYRDRVQQTSLEIFGVTSYTKTNEFKEKSKQTCLEKYGVEYSLQSDKIREKSKQTMLEKYGVEHYSQTNEFKKLYKETMLEKYGVEHYSQTNEFKEKSKQTCLKRYGMEYYTQTEDYANRYKQTCLEKYGVENVFQNEDIKQKIKNTCLEKYGVENASQSEKVKKKIRDTNLKRYGVENTLEVDFIRQKQIYTHRNNYYDIFIQKLQDKNILLDMTKEEYCSSKVLKYKCLLCDEEWECEDSNPYSIYCHKCIKLYSNKEKELVEYIKSIYNGKIIENDRTILQGKELDIYIPEYNLAIEFNGSYWHSDTFKNKSYHLEKTKSCKEKEINLIHIFEHEWDMNKDACKSIVYNILHNTNKNIDNIILKEIDNKIYNEFIQENWFYYENNICKHLVLCPALSQHLKPLFFFGNL